MRQPHQHGLGLIIERMGCDEERRAALAHPRAQQGVARGPRPLLDTRRGLAPFPAQHGVREPAIARPGPDFLGFVARILPQPVIHGRDLEGGRRLGFGNERAKAASGRPNRVRRRRRSGRAWLSRGMAGEGALPHQGRSETLRPHCRRGPSSLRALASRSALSRLAQLGHLARCCSRCTSASRAGRADGYFRPTSAKVAQAWSLAPSPRRETPSLSMLSGPLGELP